MSDGKPNGPWTVRSMAESDQQMAVEAAKRAGKTVAEWLGEAIRSYVGRERSDEASYEIIQPSPPKGDAIGFAQLLALASGDMPQWLRGPARRKLGELLGVTPPAPPPRPSGNRLRHEPDMGQDQGRDVAGL